MLSITELKKNTVFLLDGVPYRVIDYAQKVMGRGGSTVNVKIKSLIDGKVLAKTFHGSEQIESANISNRAVQYLYEGEGTYHFMDTDNYDQFEVPASILDGKTGYIKDGDMVTAQLFNDIVINIELPKNVWLKITYTEDAVRGDTSSSITKDATLETGATVKVPAFIKQNDVISVDTESGAYRERQKS
jgi:elongation factor P